MIFSLLIPGAVLVLLGAFIYGQTFGFGFVFDDHIFIVNNLFIKNFYNIHLMWHNFPTTRLVGMYSFALNYQLHQLHPAGYHIFNFLVHLTATGIVWALADLLFKMTKTSSEGGRLPFVVALFFLVHPCQTQAVTYITQRFESMATVFYLLAMYTYLRGRLTQKVFHRIRWWAAAFIAAVLGIMTKEVLLTLPVMIMAAEWIFFPGESKKKYYMVLVMAGLIFVPLLLNVWHGTMSLGFKGIPSESHDGDVLTPVSYVLTQMRVFLTFMRLLIVPIHQNLDYDYPASTGLFSPPLTFVGIVVIVGLIGAVIKLRRKYPLIAFGMSWVLITFAVNLVPRSNVIFEHKLYLISFGFFLSLVALLAQGARHRMAMWIFIGLLTACWAVMAFERNKVWSDELTLWKSAIKESPDKARVNSNLGRVYGSMGRYDDSIKYFDRAIALHPDNITYEDLGIILSQQGHIAESLADFDQSIAMDPQYFPTYVKRSWVYQSQHNYRAALADLQTAINLQPDYSDAYIERGMLWMSLGRYENAFDDFQQALKIEPSNFEVLLRQGAVCIALGRFEMALEIFTKAQELEPNSPIAASYRIFCLHQLGRR